MQTLPPKLPRTLITRSQAQAYIEKDGTIWIYPTKKDATNANKVLERIGRIVLTSAVMVVLVLGAYARGYKDAGAMCRVCAISLTGGK